MPIRRLRPMFVNSYSPAPGSWTNVDIAKHFNVHKNTVGKWLKRARSEGVENAVKGQKRGRRENTQSFLSDEQKQQLLDFITDHCPTDFGIQHSLWHSSSIRLLIKAKFGVDAAKSTLCRWLNSVGLSYQRPVKRSIQQDETKVQEWLNTTYPALVKRAAAENAIICGRTRRLSSRIRTGSGVGDTVAKHRCC